LKNKNLYKVGLLSGLVPLAVGLFIFFTWWAARAFWAIDLNKFESYGFMWIIISIPVALVGLILLAFFLVRNYPNNIKESIFAFGLILLNIPTAYWVLGKQAAIDERAYIKIYNKTKQDDIELTLKSSDFEIKLGKFSDNETMVDNYSPKYINERGSESYPTIDTVTLIVK
jgi:hypothetical protein